MKSHSVQGQLLALALQCMHQGVYFESEQSHGLSSRALIKCMGCPTAVPPTNTH